MMTTRSVTVGLLVLLAASPSDASGPPGKTPLEEVRVKVRSSRLSSVSIAQLQAVVERALVLQQRPGHRSIKRGQGVQAGGEQAVVSHRERPKDVHGRAIRSVTLISELVTSEGRRDHVRYVHLGTGLDHSHGSRYRAGAMKGSRPDQQQDRVNWLDASVVVHNPDKQVLKGLADRLRTEATGGTQSSLSAPEQRAILTTALKDLGVTVIDSEAVGAY